MPVADVTALRRGADAAGVSFSEHVRVLLRAGSACRSRRCEWQEKAAGYLDRLMVLEAAVPRSRRAPVVDPRDEEYVNQDDGDFPPDAPPDDPWAVP